MAQKRSTKKIVLSAPEVKGNNNRQNRPKKSDKPSVSSLPAKLTEPKTSEDETQRALDFNTSALAIPLASQKASKSAAPESAGPSVQVDTAPSKQRWGDQMEIEEDAGQDIFPLPSSSIDGSLAQRGPNQAQTVEKAPPLAAPSVPGQVNPSLAEFRTRHTDSESLADNRRSSNGLLLELDSSVRSLNGIVEYDEDDVKEAREYWKNTLVGAVLGARIPFSAVENFVAMKWKGVKQPSIHLNDTGVYLFRFDSEKDMNSILGAGPWMVGGTRPLILKRWQPGMKIDLSCLNNVPVWVTFPQLDLQFWTPKMLSKIGGAIGTPLYGDKMTATKERVSYARLLIGLDASQPLLHSISLKNKQGDVVIQRVEYEWMPWQCSKCKVFGHKDANCPLSKTKQIRVEKVRDDDGSTHQDPEATPIETLTGNAQVHVANAISSSQSKEKDTSVRAEKLDQEAPSESSKGKTASQQKEQDWQVVGKGRKGQPTKKSLAATHSNQTTGRIPIAAGSSKEKGKAILASSHG